MSLLDLINLLMQRQRMSPQQRFFSGYNKQSDTPGMGASNQFDYLRDRIPEETIGLNGIMQDLGKGTFQPNPAYNNPGLMWQLYMQDLQGREQNQFDTKRWTM